MRWVIWDWNGTLLDDVEACRAVMNKMLARRGLPPLSLDRYREIFTFPVREYYALAGIDLEREPFEGPAEEFMTGYRAQSAACRLMPGTADTLDALARMGVRQVLVSASRQDDLERQLAEQNVAGRFQAVLGAADDLGSGKAGLAAAYLRREDIDPADVWFVGDTLHDREVAEQVGGRCVLIAGGHQDRARLAAAGVDVLDDIRQLPGFLTAQTYSRSGI